MKKKMCSDSQMSGQTICSDLKDDSYVLQLACLPHRWAILCWLNHVDCLSRYLLHYILDYTENNDLTVKVAGVLLACLVVGLIGVGNSLFIA